MDPAYCVLEARRLRLKEELSLERQYVAYLLLAFLVFALAGLVVYKRRNSPMRKYHRRLRRERADRERMADPD